MIATLSFFIENIYNHYIVLLAQWYTNVLSPDGVQSQIGSSLRLLVLSFVRPDLFVIHFCLFIFLKKKNYSFLSLASLTNATPAFSTLWFLSRNCDKVPSTFLGRTYYHWMFFISTELEKCKFWFANFDFPTFLGRKVEVCDFLFWVFSKILDRNFIDNCHVKNFHFSIFRPRSLTRKAEVSTFLLLRF